MDGGHSLEIDYRPLGSLIRYARNVRTHRAAQVALIAGSIREFGWTNPALFANENAADHTFQRAGFNRQNPIGNIDTEMAVKSASYRLGGRGRGWQRATWIGDSEGKPGKCFKLPSDLFRNGSPTNCEVQLSERLAGPCGSGQILGTASYRSKPVCDG